MRIRRPRVRRIAPFSVNRMVPNILTLLALCAGMTAIRFAVNGQFEYAVFAIIAAGIFDGLDGRLARLLKATSSFGAELDSLSDFISFGAAPAIMLYLWTMCGAAEHRLGDGAVLRGLLRAAAGAVQHAARRRAAAMALEFLQRRRRRRRGPG